MSTPGQAVFKRIRSERWRDLRANALLLSALSLFVLVMGGGVVWWSYTVGSTHVAAFIAGVIVTMWVGMFVYFSAVTGTLSRRMGGTAEQWTSQVFSKLTKKRGWWLFHGVLFDGTDVDHVAIGPKHVLAIETKFTSQNLIARDNGHLQGLPQPWIRQAQRSARLVGSVLKGEELNFEVTPVLVLWGPGVPKTDQGWHKVGSVRVLIGKQSRKWKPFLERGSWSSDATHRAAAALQRYVDAETRRS